MASNPSPVKKVRPPWSGPLWLLIVLTTTVGLMLAYFIMYRTSSRMPAGLGLRYVWIPPVVLTFLLISAARYVQRVYHLETLGDSFQYVLASLFGLGYPHLLIAREEPKPAGEMEPEKPVEENLINVIGGPGYLGVQQGQVAVLEHYRDGVRVVGAGRHFIGNLEVVKDKLGLEERRDRIEKISATSRDGIEVVVKDVNFRYRLCTDLDPDAATGRTPENPYPYSDPAVIAMAYNRNCNADGLASWHAGLVNVVDTIITDYIRSNSIDALSAPGQVGQDPRKAIYERFYNASGKAQFRGRGAELLWIDIGHFDTADKQISEQRVSTWQARWESTANMIRAEGEARRLSSLERGRVQGQAAMLRDIVHGLEEAGLSGETGQGLRRLYLLRLAQLLEAMRAAQLTKPPDQAG